MCIRDSVWIEAAIGIGIGTVVGMGIKAIAKKLSCNMLVFLGTIMSLWSLYQSINLSIDMINGGVSREQVARYLAVLTATVILTTICLLYTSYTLSGKNQFSLDKYRRCLDRGSYRYWDWYCSWNGN